MFQILSIFLKEQIYPAKVSRLPLPLGNGADSNFEILNGKMSNAAPSIRNKKKA